MASATFTERVVSLGEPAVLMGSAAYHFVVVLLKRMLLRGELLAPILRMSQVRSEAFSRFWIKFSANGDGQAEPVGSSALIPPLLAQASGVVLDIGPGSGTQMPLFTNPGLRKMYGAEPCVGLHTELRNKITSCGLESRYQILTSGAESSQLVPALKEAKFSDEEIQKGVFDTIVCVRVLCSVSNPRETIRGLYDLLKPGGKLLVCEHVVNPWTTKKGSFAARFMQAVYTLLGWSFWMGDCHMNRDTERTLRLVGDDAGTDGSGWESVDIEKSFGWSPLSYISGTLVKKA